MLCVLQHANFLCFLFQCPSTELVKQFLIFFKQIINYFGYFNKHHFDVTVMLPINFTMLTSTYLRQSSIFFFSLVRDKSTRSIYFSLKGKKIYACAKFNFSACNIYSYRHIFRRIQNLKSF